MDTLHAIPALSTPLSDTESVSPEEIAAFLDGRVTGDERARLEAHFADNPEARRELVAASRVVASVPPVQPSRRRFAPFAAIAAAALFAIVLLKPGTSERRSTIVPVERRGVAGETAAIDLIAPLNGGKIDSGESLVWSAIDGASYSLVIMDPSGNTILEETTTDTVHAIPAILLKKGQRHYYWSVDAHMPDGSSTTSGAQEFVINPR